MAPIAGTHVLIIGGTSGIGLGVAHESLSSGARVTVASSTPSKIASSILSLQTSHPNISPTLIHGHAIDLSNPETCKSQLEALFAFAASKQTINHVIYTAGDKLPIMPLEKITTDLILTSCNVRMIAPILLAQVATKYLPQTPDSSLTLTTGSGAEKPPPAGWAIATYVGAGLKGLTRGLAVEMKPVRVNAVQPGAVDTSLWDPLGKEDSLKMMASLTLVGRVGLPEDVAHAYRWLMADGFVTGSFAATDGGYLLV